MPRAVQPQSNQRGIETQLTARLVADGVQGLNRTSVGLKHPGDRVGELLLRQGLNRTSVGLKRARLRLGLRPAPRASIEPALD